MQHRISLLVVSLALAACGGAPASPSPAERLDFALGDDAADARKIGEAVAGRTVDFPPP